MSHIQYARNGKTKKRGRQKVCLSRIRKPLLPRLPAVFRTAAASTRKRFHLSLGPQRLLHSEAASGRRQNLPRQSTGLYDISRITRTANAYREYTPRIPFNKICLPVAVILFSLLSILLFPFFFCFFCDFNMPEFTRYKKRISYRFSHREKKSCVFSAAGSLTVVLFRCPDALRRLTASPGYVIPAARLQLLLSSITLIFFFLPLHFLLLTSSLFFFSFFAYLYLRIFLFLFFYAYLYVSISPHFRSTTASIATNFPSVRMFACAFFFFFFCTVYAWLHTFLLLDTLACTFYFLFLFSLFCMHTLACIFNFTKCICLPDVMYFFCVYLYVCILLLEVYIQGCVFIYKNAYLKRTHKKKKCIHYVAHFFLPAAAGRVFKMYIHACTFKKPAQRAGHISKNAYICRHIFSVVLCIHMHTLFFLLSQFRRHSSAAGIPTEMPLSHLHRLQPYIFCTSFSS